MKQELTRAANANKVARQALKRMLELPGPQVMAMLVAQVAAALGENLEAIREVEQIIGEQEDVELEQEK